MYEAGFSAFVLHRVLTKAGITNLVVNPASVAVAANDKVKTDRRDSKKLAIDLADGRLQGFYVPTEKRKWTSAPAHTRADCRAPCHDRPADQSETAPVWLDRSCQSALNQQPVFTGERCVVAPPGTPGEPRIVGRAVGFATRRLIEMRRLLREQAQAQQEIEKVYRSVPGIGEVAARTLATELGDMTRFANERALFSYTGLTPASIRRGPPCGAAILAAKAPVVSVTCSWKSPGARCPVTRCSKRYSTG